MAHGLAPYGSDWSEHFVNTAEGRQLHHGTRLVWVTGGRAWRLQWAAT